MTTKIVVNDYLTRWVQHYGRAHVPDRYCKLSHDLYEVRNAGYQDNRPITDWPQKLIHADDEVMACLEHYFLCRCWVGTGQVPAWQMKTMKNIYNLKKSFRLQKQHNPNNPVTSASEIQKYFQNRGIKHGEADLKNSGGSAPNISIAHLYAK